MIFLIEIIDVDPLNTVRSKEPLPGLYEEYTIHDSLI